MTAFLSIVISAALVTGGVSYVTADEQQKETRELGTITSEISEELREYLQEASPSKVDEITKIQQLKTEYSSEMDAAFQKIAEAEGLNYNLGTDLEKDTLKQLVIQDILKRHKIADFEKRIMASDNLGVMSFDWPIQIAHASACTAPPSVNYFKQAVVDVNGQSGFEGGNALFEVEREAITECYVKYTLSFHDEDHPNPWLDDWYDQYRLDAYGRIHDIEEFYVHSGGIYIPSAWSNGQDFFTWTPTHYGTTMSHSTTIYVSNTWNHQMDITDENPGMPKLTWLF